VVSAWSTEVFPAPGAPVSTRAAIIAGASQDR
jgi:hypothetical protein